MSVHFDDIEIGAVRELGSHTFTREAIVDFAGKYDPQPFHLDDAAAAAGLYGKLSASGWHTTAIWLRLLIDERNRTADFMRTRGERPARYGPSPGFEKLRWLKPVFVGDTIRYTTKVIEKRELKSRPDQGMTFSLSEGPNQHGELVFAIISKIFVERRQPGPAA